MTIYTLTDQDIMQFVKTKSDMQSLLATLRQISESLFNVKGTSIERIAEYLPYDQQKVFLSLCKKNAVSIGDSLSIQKFISFLIDTLEKVPVVTLILSFKPHQGTIQAFSDWFLTEIHHPVILDIVVDSMIIGGAIIQCNGISKDFSLKRRLELKYQANEL